MSIHKMKNVNYSKVVNFTIIVNPFGFLLLPTVVDYFVYVG
jgi:hypothetical protein